MEAGNRSGEDTHKTRSPGRMINTAVAMSDKAQDICRLVAKQTPNRSPSMSAVSTRHAANLRSSGVDLLNAGTPCRVSGEVVGIDMTSPHRCCRYTRMDGQSRISSTQARTHSGPASHCSVLVHVQLPLNDRSIKTRSTNLHRRSEHVTCTPPTLVSFEKKRDCQGEIDT